MIFGHLKMTTTVPIKSNAVAAAAVSKSPISIHGVAEELRMVGHVEMDMENYMTHKKNPLYPEIAQFSQFYANIPDDYACIKMFFAINRKSITKKGVTVSDKYPKMFQFCLEIYNRGIDIGTNLEREFDDRTTKFKDTIVTLKDTDPVMAEMFKVELSAGVTAISTITLNFDEMTALIVTPGMAGGSDMKAKFSKGIDTVIRILRGEGHMIDTTGFSDDIKKFFVLYEKLSPPSKETLCDDFKIILNLFAKCVFVRRFPIVVSGKLLFCSTFISDLQVRDIFNFLGIPVDKRLAVCEY